MLKMVRSALIGWVAISGSAFAAEAVNFTGQWHGTGVVTESESETYQCDDMDFKVTHTETKISAEGIFKCDGLKVFWGRMDLVIQANGELYSTDGLKVGQLSDNRVDFEVERPGDSKRKWSIALRSDGTLHLDDYVLTSNLGKQEASISADFSRTNAE